MTRLLLVDDQVLFVDALKSVIEKKGEEIEVVGVAYNGREALEQLEKQKPHAVLLDVRMPVMDGVETARIIHQQYPETRILMLTTFDDDAYVHEALKCGACGYLLKDIRTEDLLNSLKAALSGTIQISPHIANHIISGTKDTNMEEPPVEIYDSNPLIEKLSRREREILYLMSRGYDNHLIASRLFVAEQTIKNHISHIYHKLEVHDRMSVMKVARNSFLKEYCSHLLD